MRILFLIPSLQRGSAEHQLVLLARGLLARQRQVHVCTLLGGGPLLKPLDDAGVSVEVLGNGRRPDPRGLLLLRQRLQTFAPDVIHTWRLGGNLWGRLAAVLFGRVPIIATAHWPESDEPGWQSWLVRRLHRWTARWVVPDEGLAADWQARGVAAEKLAIIPPGVASSPVSARAVRDLRSALALPAGAQVILWVGRLILRKGGRDAIWALDILRHMRTDPYLLFAGTGPLRERLEQFASDLDLRDRVRFLGARDDVPALLQLADVLWLTSHADDIPLSVLEALAAGCPVVATRLPAIASVITDGESGFVVPAGDKPPLARHTYRLLQDAELRQRFADAGRRLVAARFAPERMVEQYIALYQEVSGGVVSGK